MKTWVQIDGVTMIFFFLLSMWDNWYFKSRNRDFGIPYSFRDPYRMISFRIHMDIYTYFIWWFLAHHSILMQIYLLYFNYSSYDFICRCIYVKTKQLLNSNLNKNTDLQTTNYGELGHRNYNINYDITVLNVSFVHMWFQMHVTRGYIHSCKHNSECKQNSSEMFLNVGY